MNQGCRRWKRAAVWGPVGLAVFLTAAIARAGGQGDYDRRIGSAETDIVAMKTDVAVIKNRIDNIEWLGKAVLGAVLAQLVLSAFTGLRARESDKPRIWRGSK